MADHFVIWGVVIHLIVDWLLQNQWMADNKSNPRHLSGYVHAGLHALALCVIFPPAAALTIGCIHYLIDLRTPLIWWRRVYGQTTDGPVALHVAIWGDQVAHIFVIALAALLCAHLSL